MMRRILLTLMVPAALQSQSRDLAAVADTVFARWNSTHTPGCAVGIARDGRVLLTRGFGMADLETGAPITAASIFESGSVAKQFTATAVVLLALDGKLGLDDPVRKYLPEMPAYDRPITIRHLLTHTSGLRDWSNLVAATGWPRGSRAHTQADLLDILFRQKSLNYPVGDFYSYTNSGYAIAMSLVERVSGQTFQQFTQERIFRKLGMTSTQWRDDFTRLVPGRAQAYTLERDGWHLEMPFESVVGPGGLLTTVSDWLTWTDAIANRKLGAVSDSLTRRMRLTSGRDILYALGVNVTNYRGVPEISHSGSTGGYETYLARYPDRGNLSIAVLCNSTVATPGTYVHLLADRLIADFPRPAMLDTSRADSATLARFAGIYRNDRTRAVLDIAPQTLARLRALPGGWFLNPTGARWQFEPGPTGPTGLRSALLDGDTLHFTFVGVSRWVPTAAQLREFEGRYRSDEVGVTYDVRLVGDTLQTSARPGTGSALRPLSQDVFTRGASTVWFTRASGGRIAAMHISEARMWDLVLPRVP